MNGDIRFWAKRYKDAGWAVLPILKGEKGTRDPGWLKRASEHGYKVEDFPEDANIGAVPGKPSGDRVDIDLDAPTAVAASSLLPTTGLIHGRPGKPQSHHWFHSPGIEPRQFKDPVDKAMLLEIRANNGQTVLPPSVHPSGEAIAWASERAPLAVLPATLTTVASYLAIVALLSKYWPGQGSRHQLALSTAGFLSRYIEDLRFLEAMMEMVFTIAHDEEIRDRMIAVRDTLKKPPETKTSGAPTFRLDFPHGDAIADVTLEWLGAEVSDAIERLNERFFLVDLGGKTVVTEKLKETYVFRTFTDFRQKLVKAPPAGRGKKTLADAWLTSKRGRQYENFLYAPPGAKQTAGEEDYNGWHGFALEPQRGDWSLNREHLYKVICNESDEVFTWIMDWCAALMQEPGKHAEGSIVLLGGQGTGKGHFVDKMLGHCFDPHHYTTVIDRRCIFGDFNEVISGRVLIFLDESTWGGDKKDAGIIKGLVTGDTININRKHISMISEPSMLHLIIASNEQWPIGLDPDDRRFCVVQVQPTYVGDQDYWTALHQELDRGGRAAMLYDLLERKYAWDGLRLPPNTSAKRDLKGRTLDTDAKWWYECLLEGQVLEGEMEWPSEVKCTDLYNKYLRDTQSLRARRILFSSELGQVIKRFVPTIERTRRREGGGARNWVYILPSLTKCRQLFELTMRSHFRWPEHIEQKDLDDPPF